MFDETLLVEDNSGSYKDQSTVCQKLHEVFV